MNKKTILALLCFTIAIIGILSPVNAAVETVNSEDKTYTIESKEKTAKIKLTWNGNGGTIGGKKTVTTTINKDKKIKLPATPKRTEYTFNGWYTKKSGGSKISANTVVKNNAAYFAQWKAKSYTLTLDANGGTVSLKSKKVGFNKAIGTLPTPTRSGYTFTGWTVKKSGGSKISVNTKLTKNTAFYAQWKKVANSGNNDPNKNDPNKNDPNKNDPNKNDPNKNDPNKNDISKLVGTWRCIPEGELKYDAGSELTYTYTASGTFTHETIHSPYDMGQRKGSYSLNNGKITETNRMTRSYDEEGWTAWKKTFDSTGTIQFGSENGKQYIIRGSLKYYKI